MGAMTVWMLRYGGYAEPDPADPTPYFALVTRDWQTLPAYDQVAYPYLPSEGYFPLSPYAGLAVLAAWAAAFLGLAVLRLRRGDA